ncbi:MAG: GNAT family N-acetyltransferase [Pseudomonadota bacterium]
MLCTLQFIILGSGVCSFLETYRGAPLYWIAIAREALGNEKKVSIMTGLAFEFRHAESRDVPVLASLLLEANRHYWGEVEGASEMTSEVARAIVDGRSGCRAVLALREDRPVGFATITILHPAPNENGTLFRKDLFVSESARGVGLGKIFMRYLAHYAVKLGCHRFDWTAESDNPRALRFYDDLTASRVSEKVYFRFSGSQLKGFAGSI